MARKSTLDENMRNLVIERCWFEIHQYLIDKEVPREDKIKVAVVLASKTVPQHNEADQEELINSQLEFKIPKNGKGLHRFEKYIHQ